MKDFNVLLLAMLSLKHLGMFTHDEKLCKNLIFVLIKFAQSNLYKCITWLNVLGKANKNGISLMQILIFTQEN
jgi:hypothetical protein